MDFKSYWWGGGVNYKGIPWRVRNSRGFSKCVPCGEGGEGIVGARSRGTGGECIRGRGTGKGILGVHYEDILRQNGGTPGGLPATHLFTALD